MATRSEKLEKDLSNYLGYPVWIVKKGRYWKIQRVDNGNFVNYLRFKNLDEIEGFIEFGF